MYDNQMSLKFELEDDDGRITKEFTVDDIEAWTHIILKCADFLSAHYGYGVSERILFITDHPYGRESDYAISKKEYQMILQHRKREDAINSLWDEEEDTQ